MSEEYYSAPISPARKSGGAFRAVLGAAFLAFIAGAALIGWLIWDGRISLPGKGAPKPAPAGIVQPEPSASPVSTTSAMFEQHVAALEQRLARINLQAAAAEGNAARAEALLVAMAVRRSLERGEDLGYLEEQLRLRFGTARPAAVNTIIAAARDRTTLPQLSAELDQLGRVLSGETETSAWSRFHAQLSGLFVVHRDAPRASAPENRLARAQLLLRTGQTEAAIETVNALPAGHQASAWAAKARNYANAMKALDQIEQTALAEPEKLKAGTGEQVRQPGPAAAAPSPTPAASTGGVTY